MNRTQKPRTRIRTYAYIADLRSEAREVATTLERGRSGSKLLGTLPRALMFGVAAMAMVACNVEVVDAPEEVAPVTPENVATTTGALNAVPTGGTAYSNQCAQNLVPLPEPWSISTLGTGNRKWNQMGFGYDDGFTGNPFTTVYTMESANPPGICAINVNVEGLFSVICQGTNGKACFWEAGPNYWPTIQQNPPPPNVTSQAVVIAGSTFPAAPDPNFSQCTACHAGENAFITHVNLDHPTNQRLVPGWMPANDSSWFNPIVPSWWAQNPGPSTTDISTSCTGCHTNPSARPPSTRGGRFPNIRTAAFSDYGGSADSFCSILRKVVNRPPGQGGMPMNGPDCTPDFNCALQTDPTVAAMVAACGHSAPPAPTNLTAAAGNHQIVLTWKPVAGSPSYSVYRGTTPGGESATPIATGIFRGLTDPNYTDTGRTNGTRYYYKVAAVNATTNGTFTSAMSNEASAVPGALSRASWTVSASVTSGGDVASRAIDGNTGTRWSSGSPQSNATTRTFTVDMGTAQTFSKIILASNSDYARNYQVFASNSTSNWGTAIATGSGAATTTINFAQRTNRYIQIRQTTSAGTGAWWSIYELNVYQP